MESENKQHKYNKIAFKIKGALEKKREHYIALLCGLLRFRTISGDYSKKGQRLFRKEISGCHKYLQVAAEELGMEYRNYDDIAAVAELKAENNTDQSLGIAAHIDVVPAGKGWKYPAFGGTVAEDHIWGRGTQDDKGPIAAVLAALDILSRMQLKPRKNIMVMLGTLEETDDWPDIDLLREKGELPDQTIVPDGTFPIINAEKGMVMLKMRADWPLRKGREDDPEFISLRSGRRHNMVPARADLLLGASSIYKQVVARKIADSSAILQKTVPGTNIAIRDYADPNDHEKTVFEITFRGQSAHGAYPEKGHNAALDALLFLKILPCGGQAFQVFVSELAQRCALLDGSGFDIKSSHEYMGNTTVNLGVVELRPDFGVALINIRYPEGLNSGDIRGRFEKNARQIEKKAQNLKVRPAIHGRVQEALHISKDDHPQFIQTLQDAYQTITGREPKLRSIAGTTYSKAFPSAVAFGPLDESAGDVEMAHEINERISVDRYLENIAIYAMALALLAYEN